MKIYFKSIQFKNILSYGNSLTEVDISNGLTVVTGKNGHGKSVLLDALSYCLFGKPYREIKMDELLNRRNKKELVVSCSFTVDGKTSYKLTRGMKPDTLILEKDGVEIDLLSSKKLNQVEIDKILGIDYDLFKQIISLSINHNKPFLALGVPKKREIVEQIFNVSIICEMVKLVKKDQSDLKIAIDMLDKVVTLGRANANSTKIRLDDIERAEISFNDKKNKEIADLNEKKSKLTENLKIVMEKGKNCKKTKDSIEVLDVLPYHEKVDQYREERAILREKSHFSENLLKNLDSYSICPTCNTDLTRDHKTKEVAVHKAIFDECYEKVKKLDTLIEKLNQQINEQHDLKRKLRALEYELTNLHLQAKALKDQLSSVSDMIKSVESRVFDINVDAIREEYKLQISTLKASEDELTGKNVSFKTNEKVLQVLSETGIKAYIFKKIVPVLNNIINQYLTYFDLNAEITFDELMQETIIDLRHQSKKVSYESFSEGEKKRIDMAILLSFLKITKSLANWNCNLLVVDELLDSSVDEEGLEKLLDSLKTISKDSKNLAILLISHRLQQGLVSKFDKIISIEKGSNGFSALKVKEV